MIASIFGLLASFAMSQPAHAEMMAGTYLNALPTAADVTRPQPPTKQQPDSLGVRTSADSAFVVDLATGSVLYAKDPHHVQPIASLTKLVTAMVFLDLKPDMTKTVTFIDADFDHEASSVFSPGESITYEDALRSMMVGSVNASASALARSTIGMDAFVAAMNEKVKTLGLQSPVFVEPSGIDRENRADAADVGAILATAVGYPEIRTYTELPQVVVHERSTNEDRLVRSTNLLLGTYLNKAPYTIVAAKTGSLPEAGFCMAQVTKNAEGHSIVVVELGSENHFSRFQDIKALTTWAFDVYAWQ